MTEGQNFFDLQIRYKDGRETKVPGIVYLLDQTAPVFTEIEAHRSGDAVVLTGSLSEEIGSITSQQALFPADLRERSFRMILNAPARGERLRVTATDLAGNPVSKSIEVKP